MPLSREQFAVNLKRGTEAVRRNIARSWWNALPEQDRYFVLLNGSFDGNPLAPGEHVFPDHDTPQVDARVPRTSEEVVERLWRSGKIPESLFENRSRRGEDAVVGSPLGHLPEQWTTGSQGSRVPKS
jgi:hypothetical protein